MATLLPPTDDTSQSALELLKPDPPMENAKKDEDEIDDLDALRQAALMSIRPKKSVFKVQAHPVRQNLLSIVPVEDEPQKSQTSKPSKLQQPLIKSKDSPSRSNKFNRYDSGKSSDEEQSEYEEIEVEEEVTATESEPEQESGKNDASKEGGNKKELVKKQISEADDILNVDCTDEVDEFTNFLNEFEDELKPKAPKPKKKKKILVKKRVKKEKPAKNRRSRSRSPIRRRSPLPPHRRPYSPGRRYSPPYYRRHSRSPSPYYRRPRRYSRSPSPRRYRSRSPRPYRSPRRGSPGRYR